jgi:hypothetical protein
MRAGDVKCPRCGEGFATLEPSHEIGVMSEDESSLTLGFCTRGHELQVHVVRTPDGDKVDVRSVGGVFS